MTAVEEQGTGAHAAPDAAAAAAAAAARNPVLVGVPTFVVGAVALGLYLIGFTGSSSTALIGLIPVLFGCTAVGQLVACIWAIREGQGAVAAVFGIFGGFWFSFAILGTALGNDWFGSTSSTTDPAAATAMTGALETFLLSWLVLIVILTIAGLRLPAAFTAIFVFVDIALVLVLLGTASGSTTLLAFGGIAVFIFALLGAYAFIGAVAEATGGKPLPLGKPIVGG